MEVVKCEIMLIVIVFDKELILNFDELYWHHVHSVNCWDQGFDIVVVDNVNCRIADYVMTELLYLSISHES